jgi:CelD/BcsL family acetyltransferase involved in cellulose biosynthesis
MAVASWTRLPETFEEYLATRPSELRNTLKKTNRRLDRAGVEFMGTTPNDVPRALDEFTRLHAMRWGADAPFSRTIDALRDVIPEAVARGHFALYQLVVDGSTIAIHSCHQFGNLFGFWAGARDPTRHEWRGSGTVLLAKSINRACEMGFTELDFGAGEDAYKQLWTDEVRTLCEIRSGVPAFASRAMVGTEVLARKARKLSRRSPPTAATARN